MTVDPKEVLTAASKSGMQLSTLWWIIRRFGYAPPKKTPEQEREAQRGARKRRQSRR